MADKPKKQSNQRKAQLDATGAELAQQGNEGMDGKTVYAVIVSGKGTDEDISKRCAEHVPGWDDLSRAKQSEMVALLRDNERHSISPEFTAIKRGDGKTEIDLPDTNPTLMGLRQGKAFATNSSALANKNIWDLINFNGKSSNPGQDLNAQLAFITGGNAENTVQSALLTQMAATHAAAMVALSRSHKAEYVETMQVYGNISAKLLNAFARQSETLNKLQRGGEQVVKHVHVDNRNGGQTLITDTIVKGGGSAETQEQVHEQGIHGTAMLGQDSQGNGVPVPCDERQEALSTPRRQGDGRAKG